MNEFVLSGLDGANPLAYLAALGTLRTSAWIWKGLAVQLHWTHADGGWRPCLTIDTHITRDEWLTTLDKALRSFPLQTLPFSQADNLTIALTHFRNEAMQVQHGTQLIDGRCRDFIAAFGSEAVEAEQAGKKTGDISDTAFRTMSGSGHQHFLKSMRNFLSDTREEHLQKALFHRWKYDDPIETHTMRWDPRDDIRYALRWNKPSGDPTRKISGSMWGANRLAIEAMPLYPTAPVNGRLQTTGFQQRRREGTFWSWPIWTCPIQTDTVKSLLALAELQEEKPARIALHAMGIAEVFRCRRITVDKFRNFTSAFPV